MNRAGRGVVAVLMAMVVAAGMAGMAHAAQSSPAAVLPPVPAPVAAPTAVQNKAVSPAKPVVAPIATATASVPIAVAPSAAKAANQVKAAPIAPVIVAEPQASAGAQTVHPITSPMTTAAVAPPLTSSQAATAVSNGTSANRAAQSKPISTENGDAVPIWTPDLPPHVAAQPAAAPPALAAIMPPSAAHPDYLRLNGVTLGEQMLDEDNYAMRTDPSNWIVRIFKHNHRLEVYYRDNLYKSYHAVFGRSEWPGAKELENDRRTPEGDYMIVQKHPSRRFDWFLKINYPNAEDRAHFEELRDEGEIPRWVREGGQVGIHGTDDPLLNVDNINWTTGCISIDNGDITELARLLPIGTVVIIKP
ncbi:MAG TPA: L,D-transpeptidase family protein [Candidatus Binataceae bacterium]|nr:L,D-transpeptidase family protein [Candidatus Binataceae bacterium]